MGVAFLLVALWMVGRSDRIGPRPGSEAQQLQLTANPIENPVVSAAISPDGRYLAYADLSGLFLRPMDTGETHRVILPEGFEVREVDWFPEGTNLLFSAVADGALSLWKIPILGGEPRKLRENVWRAAVSPDGSLIAFLDAAFPPRAVQVMGPNGENPRKIVEAGAEDSFVELAWSPDGERLAYGKWHSGPEGLAFTIESIHLESGRTNVALSDKRLFQVWRGILPFSWTPDGRLIYALHELPPNHESSNLWALPIDLDSGETSGAPARVTQLAGYNFQDLFVTADGNKLSYLLERNQSDIYVGELGDEGATLMNVRRLTLDERNDYPGTWMPDSREVLFHSNRSGNWALWRQSLEEADPESLATTGQASVHAALDATVSWILHWSSDDLMRLPATRGPSERVLTTSWGGEDVTFRGFRCGRAPGSGCVLGERDTSQTEYVFSSFDPVAGRGDELLRVEDKPPFTFWDLSPEGTHVAMVHRDDRIRLIELSSGAETELAPEGWMGGEYVAWSADGKSLFLDGAPLGSTVFKMELHHMTLEGEVHVLRRRTNEWNVLPVPSPDGRYLAFAAMVFSGNAMLLEGF